MSEQQNVLVIMSDEHAFAYSGAYGHETVETPHIDSISHRGVTFDAAYCNSPICAPARAAFLTGLLPSSTELWSNGLALRSDIPTWAHYASHAGYETVLIGKQHFSGPDQHHGFERRLVEEIHSTRIRPYSYVSGAPDPTHYFRSGPGESDYTAHDRDVTRQTVDFLEGRDGSRPFAVCASLFSPHFPFIAPDEFWERYWPSAADLPDDWEDQDRPLHPAWEALRDLYRTSDRTEADVRKARAAYYALTTFMDECVGHILEALERSGELENTIIVYTSDHGEHLGRRRLWFKKTFFEESVRVPLIISDPSAPSQRGTRRGDVVSLVDVGATVIDWVGEQPVEPLDGRSLRTVVEDETAPWIDRAISEFYALDEMQLLPDEPRAWLPRRMLRDGRYKLSVFGSPDDLELYDLETDPLEERDLSADPAYAKVRERLAREATVDWDGDRILERLRSTASRSDIIMRGEATYLGQVPKAMGMK